jgi:pilus assembly protein CpaB
MSSRPLPHPPPRLVAAYRSLRRAVRLRRRLLAAALAAAAVAAGLDVLRPPPPPSEPVLVAAADLPGGGVLGARDLVVRRLPPQAVPAGALRSPHGVLGRVLAAPVRAGEPLTDVRVVAGGLVRAYGAGTVAAPVRIADADAVALLRPGDRVDVLAPDPRGEAPPAVAVSDAPVVAVPEEEEPVDAADGALVVLAVAAEESAQIARFSVLGPLVVVIRE